MIKIFKYLYIHWLFILLVVFSYINRQLEVLFISYVIMLVHEMSHLCAAKYLGLTVSHITIYPFGVNLRLKNNMIYSISDEVILYVSGPLSNILMAILVLPFKNQGYIFYDFYLKNIAYFVINMLPLLPLDGGMIVKKILNYRLGFDLGNKLMRDISFVFMTFGIIFVVRVLYINEFNISVLIFVAFILGNFLVSKEKYNKTLIKELLYNKNKKSDKKVSKVKTLSANTKTRYIDIIKKFNMASEYVVFFTNENQKIVNIMTEEEIIDNVMDNKI